jgi:CubicO group peptidase (beta-lactamase class C family)
MRVPVRARLALGIVVVLSAVTPRAQTAPPIEAVFATAEQNLRAAMAKLGLPGAAFAVVVGDKVVWSKGVGVANVETQAPVTPDTLFQVGSVTKSFTAAAVLAAAAEGVVALDRPIATYVQGLTACVGQPTLQQLLSNSGGIMDEPDEFGPQGEEGLGAYQRTWTSEYCLLPPGRAFSYSNSGFSLAGLALQEAEKKPYADVVRARVLTPLGMPRSTFRPTEAMTWPLAVGHRIGRDGAAATVVRPLANDARLWPAGTIYSTANEMARFTIALLNDGVVDGKQALPKGVATRMRTAVIDIPPVGERYGQGMFIRAQNAGHDGTMTGYVAHYALEPAFDTPLEGLRMAMVLLTNGDIGNPQPLIDVIRPAARAAAIPKNWVPGAALSETISIADGGPYEVVPLPAAQAAAFVGTYRNPRRFTVEVVAQGNGLVLKRFNRDFPMTFIGDGRFTVDLPRGGQEVVVLGVGKDGRAEYLQMNVWALARVPDAK